MGRVGKRGAGWKALFAVTIGLAAAGIMAAHAFAGGGTLTIGHVTLLPGDEAQMQLKATNIGAPGLGAWQIDIDYDADVVTPTSCTAGPSSVCNTSYASGSVRVVGANATGIQGNITLATLRFRCNVEGATALALTAIEFADPTMGAPQPLDIGVQHGSVNCLAPEPPPSDLNGDANCDGVVNSIDALIVLQFVARLRSSVPCPNLADYNHDGRITAVDAALILQRDAGLI